MSNNSVIDKIKAELDRNVERTKASKQTVEGVCKDVFKNKDLMSQIAQELNAIKSGHGGKFKMKEGFSQVGGDDDINPLEYED